MGQDKALLTYGGRTFLETIVATLQEAGMERVGVVLGHHAQQIQDAMTLEGAEIVINRDYTHGQTSSLQTGLRALESPSLEAIVLCLVDHPLVSADTVRRLVASFRQAGAPVVIPTFRNQRGHPVLIGRALFEELKGLSPDEGANTVIRKHRDAAKFVDVGDEGILIDVDNPDVYRRRCET